MKHIKLILLALLLSTNIHAQDKSVGTQPHNAEIEKIIKERLKLTDEESARLMPVYREQKRLLRKLFHLRRNYMKIKVTSPQQAEDIINKTNRINAMIPKIQKEYQDKFLKIISADKVLEMIKTEHMFYHKYFKSYFKNKEMQETKKNG